MRGNTALALKSQPIEALLPEPPEEDVVIPMSEMVTIMELKESMCRWPMGDPSSGEFRFCGGKKGANQSGPYCSYHARIAYQPAQDRRAAPAIGIIIAPQSNPDEAGLLRRPRRGSPILLGLAERLVEGIAGAADRADRIAFADQR